MLKLFLILLLLVGVAVLLLSVRLLAGRSFVKTHVDQSKAMYQRGIRCARSQDAAARAANPLKVRERVERSTHTHI